MTVSQDSDFGPSALPLTEITPSTLLAKFDLTFASAPVAPQYVQAGHDEFGTEPWVLHTRYVMDAWLTATNALGVGTDDGATLIIEVGADPVPIGFTPPLTIPWIPIYIPGGGMTTVITGLEIPGLVARFRFVSAHVGALDNSVNGTILLRAI